MQREILRVFLVVAAFGQVASAQVGRETPGLPEWRQTARLRMTSEGKELDYTREQLYVQGIPVWGQEAIRMNNEDRYFAAPVNREKAVPARGFAIGQLEAIQTAREHLEWPQARVALAERWWVANDLNELEPAWRVVLENGLAQVRRVTVDGGTRGVTETLDLTNRQQGQRGLAIPTNPLFSGVQNVVLPGMRGSQVLTGDTIRVSSYYPVAFLNLPESALTTPETQLARADANGNFFYPPDDPRFSEVQVYFGAARAADYIRGLGFSGLNRRFEAIAYFFNAQNPYDVNAFFTPTAFDGAGAIVLQVNALGADTAFDSDIIFHEYGHATVHAIVNSFQSSQTFRAVNEAFADYFAASYFDSSAIGEYFPYLSPAPNALLRQEYLRNIDNNTVYPDDVRGREHQDSLMFSGALWDIRQAFGRTRGDAIAINGLARMTAAGGFFSSASALVEAARSLYGNITAGVVEGICRDRGLLSDAARFQELSIPTVSGAPRQGSIPANAAGRILLGAEDYRVMVPNRSRGLRIEVEATSRTNPITAYLRFRAPVEIRNGQVVADYVLNGTNPEPGYINAVVNFESTPELQMGDYYLVVGNRSGGPLNYTVRMTVESDPQGQNSFFPVVSPGITVRGNVPTNFLNTRQFRVEVPAGATGMNITLEGQRDVDLYINYANPVQPGGEGLPLAEGISNSASNTERMTITRGTVPNLRPGTYFVAVENYERTGPSAFLLNVTFTSEANYVPSLDVVPLNESRNVFLPASTNTAVLLPRQFRVDTQAAWNGLILEATTDANVVMLVRRAQAVSFANGVPVYDSAQQISRGTGRVEFNANSTPSYVPTVYYVAFLSLAEQGGTLSFRYTPLPLAAGSGPSVAAVVDGASFISRISPGAWVTLTGNNLSRTTRLWGAQDFVGGRLPTTLDGVTVTVGGVPAWVYYISPTQLNVLVPQSLRAGTQEVVVTVDGLRSAAFTVLVEAATPGLFRFDPFDRRYAAAVFASGEFAGPAGLFGTALATRPVKRGEVVQLFATGLGNAGTQDGIAAEPVADLTSRTTVTIGGIPARLVFAGRVGPGLYQINVEAPANAPVGENEVRVFINNAASPGGVYLVVE
ncbi:MAG: pre-peptidase C-terminal domain-containing protein [Bryobacter sp.]|nr:pre-peptidase C-terminal domain-containing protein [Bryobacter sp.]